jgi:hypothetical protein
MLESRRYSTQAHPCLPFQENHSSILRLFSFTHYLFSSFRLSKLKNCFNLCLYKLFKFKPEVTPEDEEGIDEKIMSDFINKLNSYSLFTLQSRIYNKLLLFAHGIKSNKKSPVEVYFKLLLIFRHQLKNQQR